MPNNLKTHLLSIFLLFSSFLFSQNETKHWYFGNNAGLDFTNNPPTGVSNGAVFAYYSSASMSDASGNLLFYTDGATIYNSSHVAMSNGTGLIGSGSNPQGSIIVKQPGSSTIYYVFTADYYWSSSSTGGLYYSIVDMSLSSGSGSVTTKNALVYSGYVTKITGTKHCDGLNYWILTQESQYFNSSNSGTYTPNFLSFSLTATGVNTTAIISPGITYSYTNGYYDYWGSMKISPNGKKLGKALYNNGSWSNSNNNYEMYDFNISTGVVSGGFALSVNTNTYYGGWGCEFSPDGTKFYGSSYYYNSPLLQWDLCAGSQTAVVASVYSVTSGSSTSWAGMMQLAPNGKIYLSRNSYSLDVINAPNSASAACAYSIGTQSLTATSYWGLPNFMASSLLQHPTPNPFTYTVSNGYGCQAVQFNTSYTPSISVVGCSSTGYSLTSLKWMFGDPASGANNTSTLTTPIHAFTTLGNYNVSLVFYYSCGGGTDTIKQVVNVNQPCISVSSTSITCASLGSATVAATGGIGPFSYTWMPTAQASSVATGLSPGTYTITVFDYGTNFTYTASTVFTSLIPLTGNVNNASSVTCNGASTATANVTNIAGGSGSVNYFWLSQSSVSYTNPTPLLSAGLWSVTVTDAVTGCQINQSFYITQPPPMNLNLTATTATLCTGKSVTLTGVNSGGTPYSSATPYTYVWTGGPLNDVRTVVETLSGHYIYTLTSKDSYSCPISNTIAVDFIPNPIISVANVSICPLQIGVLNASGATTYTWSNSTLGSSLSDNPLITRQYTVTGSALGCTSTALASIILKPVPLPLLNSNSPICKGQNLQLYVYGGASYVWSGPSNYTSVLQNPVINSADTINSGMYSATITAVNGCTAAITKTILVNPSPTLSAAGSTVCVTQTLNLFANSFPGANFTWVGPNGFTSSIQNPTLATPGVNASGNYFVNVTSVAGCTNSAIAHVTVTALPVPIITSNNPQCFGSTLSFTGSGVGVYQWSGPNGFSSTLPNPVITNANLLNSGVYDLQVTVGPCVNHATYNATIFPLPSFTLNGNSPVCETKSLSITPSIVGNAASFLWHGPAGFGSQYQDAGRDSVKANFAGIYTLTIIDGHNCHNSATYSVTINQNPVLTALSSTVCLNQPATLTVSGAASYIWTGPNLYQSTKAEALIPIAASSVTTIYTVVGTAVNQCSSTTTASLSTLSLPLPGLSVIPANRVCLEKPVTLEGFGGVYYQWKGPGNFSYDNKVLTFTASSSSYEGTYTVIVTDEKGCTNFTTTNISINPLPQGSLLGSITDACIPFASDFTYYNSQPSAQINAVWQINSDATFKAKSFSRSFKTAGDYLINGFFVDTISTCEKTYTFVVHARPVPVADFTYQPEHPVEGLEDVIFTNTSQGEELSKWSWHFVSNDDQISTNKNSSYFFANAGIYPVAMIVKNRWGCSDTATKAITINPDFNVFVPNVFTPNGDSDNDIFHPVLTGVKMYELNIYNRWGQKVFQTGDLTAGWDGRFNGLDCKDDVYVWKINVSSQSGEMKKLEGHVTLYR